LPRRLRREKREITHICVLCGKYIVSARLTRSVNLRYLGWPVKAIREGGRESQSQF